MEEQKKSQKENKKQPEHKKELEKTISLKESEYLKLKQDAEKAAAHWDRILRLQAEFDNTRKRLERDKQEFVKFANEGIVIELLNIMDDLERSVELAQGKHEDFPAFLKGIEMILAHLYELLKEHGLTSIETKGQVFDPNFHEALMQVESDLPENTIVEELQKGYLLNNKVVRTAKVKVAKKTTK